MKWAAAALGLTLGCAGAPAGGPAAPAPDTPAAPAPTPDRDADETAVVAAIRETQKLGAERATARGERRAAIAARLRELEAAVLAAAERLLGVSRDAEGFQAQFLDLLRDILRRRAPDLDAVIAAQEAQVAAASVRWQFMQLRDALENFYALMGRYPSTGEGLRALVEGGARWPALVPAAYATDPWGHALRYTASGDSYELASDGPDGAVGTEDDLRTRSPRASGS